MAFSKDWCGCGKIVIVGKRHTPRRRGRPLRGKKEENLCIKAQKIGCYAQELKIKRNVGNTSRNIKVSHRN